MPSTSSSRVSQKQGKALQKFHQYPSREKRIELAREMGMDLQTVSLWLRRTSKRHALLYKSREPLPSLRSTVSLDRIAQLNELPHHPQTPHKSRTRQYSPDDELWTHMPSSPPTSPTSPSVERARLSILSMRPKAMRSLEWACARARVRGWGNKESRLPSFDDDDVFGGASKSATDDTDTEVDEAITPHSSVNLSPSEDPVLPRKHAKYRDVAPKVAVQFEDVDAALVLLGFMGQHQ